MPETLTYFACVFLSISDIRLLHGPEADEADSGDSKPVWALQ